MAAHPEWSADLLGAPFEHLELALEPDDEGEVVATLVRIRGRRWSAALDRMFSPLHDADVLYVHGWSDYFFQTELARYWQALGARFFALDLRKYGRSLRSHQTPGHTKDLDVYDEDIEAALNAMGHSENGSRSRRLILMGHSTGGLILSLWLDRHPGRADALVLNSPWLEFQAGSFGREALMPFVGLQARYRPHGLLPQVDLGFYTRTVSRAYDGEWEYNSDWRPERGFVAYPDWLAAVLTGHRRVASGLSIAAPVLSLLSTRSSLGFTWSDRMLTSDSVLDVDDIAERSLKLGAAVTVVRIDHAIHDVMLSKKPVRRRAEHEITRWLTGYVPASDLVRRAY
ncbi:alpha/beta hydrolase [Okibacterium endophyticum]